MVSIYLLSTVPFMIINVVIFINTIRTSWCHLASNDTFFSSLSVIWVLHTAVSSWGHPDSAPLSVSLVPPMPMLCIYFHAVTGKFKISSVGVAEESTSPSLGPLDYSHRELNESDCGGSCCLSACIPFNVFAYMGGRI